MTPHPALRSAADVHASGWRAVMAARLSALYLGFAATLIPWTGYLAVSLPARGTTHHVRGTWVGFDIALIVVLAQIGWWSYRKNPLVVLAAVAGSTMLVVDAWFDITTAAEGAATRQALLSAFFLELPAAALCALLAVRGLEAIGRISPASTPLPPARSGD